MRKTQLTLKGTVDSRSAVKPLLAQPGDAVLVVRGSPRLLVLACPCGCGDQFPANLDPRAGPAWRLYTGRDERLSLFPSIWLQGGCRSHYIIWHDDIYLFGGGADSDEDEAALHEGLLEQVLARIPRGRFVDFVSVAHDMNEIPWDVLEVCRKLRRQGKVEEGSGAQRQHFRRVDD